MTYTRILARLTVALVAALTLVGAASTANALTAHHVVASRVAVHHYKPIDPTEFISEHTLEMTGLISTTCTDYGPWPNPLTPAGQAWETAFCTGHGGTTFVRHLGWCFRLVAHDAGVGHRAPKSCVNTVNRYAYTVPNFGVAQFTAAVHAPADILAQNLSAQVFPVTEITLNGHSYL